MPPFASFLIIFFVPCISLKVRLHRDMRSAPFEMRSLLFPSMILGKSSLLRHGADIASVFLMSFSASAKLMVPFELTKSGDHAEDRFKGTSFSSVLSAC